MATFVYDSDEEGVYDEEVILTSPGWGTATFEYWQAGSPGNSGGLLDGEGGGGGGYGRLEGYTIVKGEPFRLKVPDVILGDQSPRGGYILSLLDNGLGFLLDEQLPGHTTGGIVYSEYEGELGTTFTRFTGGDGAEAIPFVGVIGGGGGSSAGPASDGNDGTNLGVGGAAVTGGGAGGNGGPVDGVGSPGANPGGGGGGSIQDTEGAGGAGGRGRIRVTITYTQNNPYGYVTTFDTPLDTGYYYHYTAPGDGSIQVEAVQSGAGGADTGFAGGGGGGYGKYDLYTVVRNQLFVISIPSGAGFDHNGDHPRCMDYADGDFTDLVTSDLSPTQPAGGFLDNAATPLVLAWGGGAAAGNTAGNSGGGGAASATGNGGDAVGNTGGVSPGVGSPPDKCGNGGNYNDPGQSPGGGGGGNGFRAGDGWLRITFIPNAPSGGTQTNTSILQGIFVGLS